MVKSRLESLPDELLVYVMYSTNLNFKTVVALSGTCKRLRNIARGYVKEQIRFMALGCSVDTSYEATHFVLQWGLDQVLPLVRLRAPTVKRLVGMVRQMVRFGPANIKKPDRVQERTANFLSHARLLEEMMGWEGHTKMMRDKRNSRNLGPELRMSLHEVYISYLNRLGDIQVKKLYLVNFTLVCPIFAAMYPWEEKHCRSPCGLNWWPEVVLRNKHLNDEFRAEAEQISKKYYRFKTYRTKMKSFCFYFWRESVYEACCAQPRGEQKEFLAEGAGAFWKQITNVDFLKLVHQEMVRFNLVPPFTPYPNRRTRIQVIKDAKATLYAGEPFDHNMYLELHRSLSSSFARLFFV